MISAPPRRIVYWEAALARLVAERARTPFVWGTHDCVTFAADAVAVLTGRDPIAAIRGSWVCEAGAALAMSRWFGCPCLLRQAVDAMAQRSGWPEIPATLAQRGDLAILAQDGAELLAVVTGERAMSPGPRGLIATPMIFATRAWSI